MGDEDLEAVDDLGEGNALVVLPALNSGGALSEDNEVLVVGLEVDLGLGSVSAHIGCVGVVWWVGEVFWKCVVGMKMAIGL